MGRSLTIRPLVAADLPLIAERIRPADREEAARLGFESLLEVLRWSFERADSSHIAFVEGEPLVAWGLVYSGPLTRIGYPWVFSAAAVDRNRVLFARLSRVFLRAMRRRCRLLEVMIDAEYTRSIAWARWLGFEISEPRPYGPLRQPFVLASMEVS